MHFMQAAIAFVAAGASVLIIGGLVRESLRDRDRHFHLFPEAHDRPEKTVAKAAKTPATDPIAVPRPRGDKTHGERKHGSRADNALDAEPPGRKRRRRNKKRDRSERHAPAERRTAATESEDA